MDVFRQQRGGQENSSSSSSTDGVHNGDDPIFDVEWRPFQIDPGTRLDGETVEDYCRRRWGGSGWTNHLKQEGRKNGTGANFNDWKWWPHTSKAHQLVHFCSSSSLSSAPYCSSDRINQLLFEAEYERGENISLVDVLVDIGRKAGVPDSKLDGLGRYLEDDEGKSNVESEIKNGRKRYGISGVPFFIVSPTTAHSGQQQQPPYGFSGAQSTETFLEIFDELAPSTTSSNNGPN
mmetsp:Transcript_54256/g.131641  ORF Transcript_54256/g.131641 Transcript_54256/m.131641 type:complete len:234 (+) Transcript_54256:124-825(+)